MRSLPTRLTRWLHGWHLWVLVLAGLTLANTVYLVAVRLGEAALRPPAGHGAAISPYFQAMLLAHSVLGTLVVAAGVLFSIMHLGRVWPRRTPRAVATGLATVTIGLTLLVTGARVIARGAGSEGGFTWWLHVVAAFGLLILYALHRRASVVRPASGSGRRFAVVLAGLVVALVGGHLLTATSNAAGRDPAGTATAVPEGRSEAIEAYGVVPPGFADPASPFFPSPARTDAAGLVDPAAILGPLPPGGEEVAKAVQQAGFYRETGIGAESCVRCHPDVTRQWEASAHRFSSFNNPFYEASIERLRRRPESGNPWIQTHRTMVGRGAAEGVIQSAWCAGCHDPALLFTGQLGSFERVSPEAQAGLTCLACHAITDVPDRTGNGGYHLRAKSPGSYLFESAHEEGWQRDVHDALLRARPQAHKVEMLPPVQHGPELCMVCHKVSLREPVNGYRWLRGQNEFDAWEDSGISLEGIQSFYLPAERRECVDCHMPREPADLGDLAADRDSVRSHRFAAANTALPYIRGDSAAVERIERYLAGGLLTLDAFGFRIPGTSRESLAIDERVVLQQGTEVELDVVTRNRGVGHAFPGGTIDSNEAWLDVRLLDSEGRLIAGSGFLDADGHLDPRAHVFGALFVDSAGDPVAHRNAQDIRALVYRNVVGPGSARLAHFRFRTPDEPGDYVVDVRLLWRKFNRAYTEFVFETVPEAFPGQESAPRLPVSTLARTRLQLRVGGDARGTTDSSGRAASGEGAGSGEIAGDGRPASSWERWNDFGIASLSEGDTRSALEAFAFVESLAPDRVDGPLNIARVFLAEGDLRSADEALDRAAVRDSDDSRVHWLRGEIALADGRYEDAAREFREVLAHQPRHRRSLLGLGRVRYQSGQYAEAVTILDRLLSIDPESLPAAYHRMLALRAMDDPRAEEAEALFEFLRADETTGRLVRKVRAESPGVNAMSQPVRTHNLRPGSPAAGQASLSESCQGQAC